MLVGLKIAVLAVVLATASSFQQLATRAPTARMQMLQQTSHSHRAAHAAPPRFHTTSSALHYEEGGGGLDALIGEDAATFSLAEQKWSEWGTFFVAVGGIMSTVFYAWIYPDGLGWGTAFKDAIETLAGGDPVYAVTYMLAFFAVGHSGLASLRPWAETIVGARVWRYIFALFSLPLAFSCIVYFINHR